MKRIILAIFAVRSCLACAPQPGMQLTGLPVDEAQVLDAIAMVNAVGFDAPVEREDVGAFLTVDFVESFEGHPNRLGQAMVTIDGPRVEVRHRGPCVARSVLVHELIHVRYGDDQHKLGAMLWNVEVADINNKLMAKHCPGEIMDGGAR